MGGANGVGTEEVACSRGWTTGVAAATEAEPTAVGPANRGT